MDHTPFIITDPYCGHRYALHGANVYGQAPRPGWIRRALAALGVRL